MELPEEHKSALIRLKQALPFRLCYGAYNPQSKDFLLFNAYIKPGKRIKKLTTDGYLIFTAQ